MYEIVITIAAEADIERNHDWWSTNRSAEQANRWYSDIFKAIETLRQLPNRCPLAPEAEALKRDVHQLQFGIGSRPSHRILFSITGELVSIVRVRHLAQDALTN